MSLISGRACRTACTAHPKLVPEVTSKPTDIVAARPKALRRGINSANPRIAEARAVLDGQRASEVKPTVHAVDARLMAARIASLPIGGPPPVAAEAVLRWSFFVTHQFSD